jgi:hypothetical protein
MIIRKGDVGDAMYFVVSGAAEALIELDQPAVRPHSPPPPPPTFWRPGGLGGRSARVPRQVGRLGPGMFFGEAALITEAVRNAYIRCMSESELLVLDKADLLGVLQAFPALRQAVLEPTSTDRAKHNAERDAAYQAPPPSHPHTRCATLPRARSFPGGVLTRSGGASSPRGPPGRRSNPPGTPR